MDNVYAWSENSKQHLSVGAVVQNDDGKILVHKLARIGGKYFLPKKTHKLNSTLEETLHRTEGETGLKVMPLKFLGSKQSSFPSDKGETVNKTTLYFLCNIAQKTQRDPNDRDADSELVWMDKNELINIMIEQGKDANDLDESEILKRI